MLNGILNKFSLWKKFAVSLTIYAFLLLTVALSINYIEKTVCSPWQKI